MPIGRLLPFSNFINGFIRNYQSQAKSVTEELGAISLHVKSLKWTYLHSLAWSFWRIDNGVPFWMKGIQWHSTDSHNENSHVVDAFFIWVISSPVWWLNRCCWWWMLDQMCWWLIQDVDNIMILPFLIDLDKLVIKQFSSQCFHLRNIILVGQ